MRNWTMQGQIFAVIIVVFTAGQTISLFLFADQRSLAVQAALGAEAAGRAANVARLIETAPIGLHEQIVMAATSPLVRFEKSIFPSVSDGLHHDDPAIEARIRALLDDPYSRDIRVEVHEIETSVLPVPNLSPELTEVHADMMRGTLSAIELDVSIALEGGGWLNVETRFERPPWQIANGAIATLLISVGLVLCAVFLFVFLKLTRPLAVLRDATDQFGQGIKPAELPDAGPIEVRSLTKSFLKMQTRISRFVADRTMMLAALAHDLRSPMTALRVNAELIEEKALRDAVIRSATEMSDMLDNTLTYARGVALDEDTSLVSLNELIHQSTDERSAVIVVGLQSIDVNVRKTAIKRAFRNLIDNALRYGTSVIIDWRKVDGSLEISFQDDGPGIPDEMLDRVLDPYVRLEESRSRDTGGHGLGLSIVKSIVLSHGGQLRLVNKSEGGLCALIRLPLLR